MAPAPGVETTAQRAGAVATSSEDAARFYAVRRHFVPRNRAASRHRSETRLAVVLPVHDLMEPVRCSRSAKGWKMRLWPADLQWRSFFAPIPTAARQRAIARDTDTKSRRRPTAKDLDGAFVWSPLQTVDRLRGALRAEIGRRRHVDFQDHSLVTARLNEFNSDKPFVEYLYSLNRERPPDLIVAIGAPAANFVQRHRAELFPRTPMVLPRWSHVESISTS